MGNVRGYVADILTGNWIAPTIIVTTKDGRLLDGYHRCHAVIQADKSIPVIIVEGHESMVHAFDQGIQRSLSDILTVDGWTHTRDLQGAVNQACIAVRYAKTGKFKSQVFAINNNRALTNREKLAILDNHKDLQEHVIQVRALSVGATVTSSRGLAAMMRSVVATFDGLDEYDSFLTSVYHGEGIHKGEPEYQLRSRLLLAKNKGQSLNSSGKFGLWARAWNLSHAGEVSGTLHYSPIQMPFGTEEWAKNDKMA